MKVFEYLIKLHDLEKHCFPNSQSLAERDICLLIGLYNERASSATLKELKSFGIVSDATLERVLQRLISEGLVHQVTSARDRRRKELKLDKLVSRKLIQAYMVLAGSNDLHQEDDERTQR
jgi:DNA-binding MarR family transcriptional regulator